MLKALKNTIEHFKINNVNKCCDFIFFNKSKIVKVVIKFDNGNNVTKIVHRNNYFISMEKVIYMLGETVTCKFEQSIVTYDDDHEEFISMNYIPFQSVYNYITNQSTSLKNIVVKAMFGEFKIHELDTHKILVGNFKPQIAFTYSVTTFLEKYFADKKLTFQVEDNFLSLERFNDIYISTTKGPRMDIIFEQIFLVIEYDEKHHNKKEQCDADKIRDSFMIAHGYKVIRMKHGDDLRNFFLQLVKVIKDRYVMFYPESYSEYIIDMFVEQGYDINQVKILTHEIALDIVRGTKVNDLGNTVGNMTFGMLMNHLQIDIDTDFEEIECLLEKLRSDEHSYNYIDHDDSFEIKLSPNATEYIMAYISPHDNTEILKFRKLYIGIKNTLMYIIFQTGKYQLENFHQRRRVTATVINETYKRCKNDIYNKVQDVCKREHLVERRNNIITQIYETTLNKNNRGVIKNTLNSCSETLYDGKPFIPEFPQLRYSVNNSDYVNLDDLVFLYEFNKRKYHIKKSCNKILKTIKENKNLIYNNTENIIYNCNLLY